MIISLIVAMGRNNIIGKNNQMPWHLPADLAWFKKNTINKPVIMGRKTYESIGKPLPQRRNIVITRQPIEHQCRTNENVIWVNSYEEGLKQAGEAEEVMIIGGSTIYALALPLANRLYLTKIDSDVEGDTFFPDYLKYHWHCVFSENHPAEDLGGCAYQFSILNRA